MSYFIVDVMSEDGDTSLVFQTGNEEALFAGTRKDCEVFIETIKDMQE